MLEYGARRPRTTILIAYIRIIIIAYIRIYIIMLLEVENALRTLVKQQVEDAEVGQEAVALRTHLIIRCGVEVGVGQRMLRANSLAEVDNCIILRW